MLRDRSSEGEGYKLLFMTSFDYLCFPLTVAFDKKYSPSMFPAQKMLFSQLRSRDWKSFCVYHKDGFTGGGMRTPLLSSFSTIHPHDWWWLPKDVSLNPIHDNPTPYQLVLDASLVYQLLLFCLRWQEEERRERERLRQEWVEMQEKIKSK